MRILIAEDDAVLRRLLQTYLERDGHTIVSVGNGAEAWKRYQEEDFPLLMTDWMMPEMDGIELVRRIRASENVRYTYILLITSRSEEEDMQEGLEAGVDDFVSKPFDQDELKVRLRIGERYAELQRLKNESEQLAQLGRRAATLIYEIIPHIEDLSLELAALKRDSLAPLRSVMKTPWAEDAGLPPLIERLESRFNDAQDKATTLQQRLGSLERSF